LASGFFGYSFGQAYLGNAFDFRPSNFKSRMYLSNTILGDKTLGAFTIQTGIGTFFNEAGIHAIKNLHPAYHIPILSLDYSFSNLISNQIISTIP